MRVQRGASALTVLLATVITMGIVWLGFVAFDYAARLRTERAEAEQSGSTVPTSVSRQSNGLENTHTQRATLFDAVDGWPLSAAVVALALSIVVPMGRIAKWSLGSVVAIWGVAWIALTLGKLVLVVVFPAVFLTIFPETADAVTRAGSLAVPLANAAIGGAAVLAGLVIPLRRVQASKALPR